MGKSCSSRSFCCLSSVLRSFTGNSEIRKSQENTRNYEIVTVLIVVAGSTKRQNIEDAEILSTHHEFKNSNLVHLNIKETTQQLLPAEASAWVIT